MSKYSYIGNSKITIGGAVIPSNGLCKLDNKTLQLAIKNNTIKLDESGIKQKRIDRKGVKS